MCIRPRRLRGLAASIRSRLIALGFGNRWAIVLCSLDVNLWLLTLWWLDRDRQCKMGISVGGELIGMLYLVVVS